MAHYMPPFSDRLGFRPLRQALQVEAMADSLRNRLWNLLYSFLWDRRERNARGPVRLSDRQRTSLEEDIWDGVVKQPLYELYEEYTTPVYQIRKWFFKTEWYRVYDLLEFVSTWFESQVGSPTSLSKASSDLLTAEGSGYRFVGNRIEPIVGDAEISAIEDAVGEGDWPWEVHLATALDHLGKRPEPDLRNCVKEAISAVEAIAQEKAGKRRATLGDAVKVLERQRQLHPALKKALAELYGYSSDGDGIRHALVDEPNLTLDLARFQLVVCSAFVNLLKAAPAASAGSAAGPGSTASGARAR
ncbi:MAG TPA: hypothetical protein VF017_12915 [Thermoanaerobaculia bacterium]|nr:hypothetical protein [Thermoanaerobaculia bacterium]